MSRLSTAFCIWGLGALVCPLFAITVEVASGEDEAVCRAAEALRQDIARACPTHETDARRIVVRTRGTGAWESSIRTYENGIWTVTGADRRGTIYGIYAISDELGVSPFHWLDDIPVVPSERFGLSTKTLRIQSPAVRYRGIFINDEGWCLREWAVKNYEADGTKSLGVKTYEKIFEMMLRCRLNVLWPAMHPGGYEFVTRPENMALAKRMGIIIGTSHCEPMLRNNVYWNRVQQGPWNYATNRAEIDRYWQWSVDRYLNNEVLWTIGIRGTHDEGMAGGESVADKIALMESVFQTQLKMLGKGKPVNFVPYKEVLPIYEAGLKVPKEASIMWVDDNFGYIRRLGGPQAADHPGGMYWHVSYFGGPHSYTHVCSTAPGFMWYELGAKCIDNNVREIWILNVGDVKPADVLIDAFAKIAWDSKTYGPESQPRILLEWAKKLTGGGDAALTKRIVRHMTQYYALATVRKPELMARQWVERLSAEEKSALQAQYVALEKEDYEIEKALARLASTRTEQLPLAEAWFGAFGFQARFLAVAGQFFVSADVFEPTGRARVEKAVNALGERYAQIFAGKWRHFWYDTFPARGWDNTENGWASQMQWPWKEPSKGRHYAATAGSDGIRTADWTPAARCVRSGKKNGGAWVAVPGLGVSGRAMALLPVKEGVGQGACLDYELEAKEESPYHELVLRFLPDYRLYPGLKLRVNVRVNDGPARLVEVPYSDGTKDENSQGRNTAVQDNFVRAILPCPDVVKGTNRIRITAVDPGVVLDALTLRVSPEKLTHPFERATLRGGAAYSAAQESHHSPCGLGR